MSIFYRYKLSEQCDTKFFSTSSNAEATMPVSKDSTEYNMNHSHRGHALIFNHEIFTMENMPPRKGSHLDAARLQTTFTTLGFSVQVFNDLSCENIKTRITHGKLLSFKVGFYDYLI